MEFIQIFNSATEGRFGPACSVATRAPNTHATMHRCAVKFEKHVLSFFKVCTMNIKQPPEVHIATCLESALQSLLYAALCGMLMTI